MPVCGVVSEDGLGWEGPFKDHLVQPLAMGKDTFHQTRLLRAPSSLALNAARERAATASLGNLCQGLTPLIVKNFFRMSNLNLPSFRCPSPLLYTLV